MAFEKDYRLETTSLKDTTFADTKSNESSKIVGIAEQGFTENE